MTLMTEDERIEKMHEVYQGAVYTVVNENHGTFAAKMLAKMYEYDRDRITGPDPGDYDILLAGPDHPAYFDVANELDSWTLTPDDTKEETYQLAWREGSIIGINMAMIEKWEDETEIDFNWDQF